MESTYPEICSVSVLFEDTIGLYDEDCRCGRKFWTLYIFYWIKVFLKLPFAISFSVFIFYIYICSICTDVFSDGLLTNHQSLFIINERHCAHRRSMTETS